MVTDLDEKHEEHQMEEEMKDMEEEDELFQAQLEDGAFLNANGNLCMDQHLVPEFFLLGAMKTSTTTLAAHLFKSTSIVQPHVNGHAVKELHFFDQEVSVEEDKASWLAHYPNCQHTKRVVATDCTPAYIRHPTAAKTIAEFYDEDVGNGEKLADSLKFMVLLREPLKRAQSAFYHHKAHNQLEDWEFPQFVQKYLDRSLHGHSFDRQQVMLGSEYPKQFATWFESFDPSQFWVVPFLYNVIPNHEGQETSLTSELWDALGVPAGEYNEAMHLNIHSHPDIVVELDEFDTSMGHVNGTLMGELNAYYEEHVTNELAAVLAHPDNLEAVLFGFDANPAANRSSVEDIKSWLVKGW